MSLKVMVVEDEVLIAQTIGLYLKESGHELQCICISYEEAVRSYESSLPDLVILDIRLYGEKSGIDFAHFLKSRPEKVPFIFLTSQFDRKVFNLALETQPYGYLAKPIQKESLWMTVETAFRLSEDEENGNAELTIVDGRKTHKVRERDIISISSDHVYANVFLLNGEKITVRKSLSQLISDFSGKALIQCHRSHVINIQHVTSWDKNSATLVNGEEVPVSRSRKQLLSAHL